MPTVINRHHYLPTVGAGPMLGPGRADSRRPLPEPWIYVGRGTPLGNPFFKTEVSPILKYRRHLFRAIEAFDWRVWLQLRSITDDTHLVCSCAPRPCHADEIAKAWAWLRREGRL